MWADSIRRVGDRGQFPAVDVEVLPMLVDVDAFALVMDAPVRGGLDVAGHRRGPVELLRREIQVDVAAFPQQGLGVERRHRGPFHHEGMQALRPEFRRQGFGRLLHLPALLLQMADFGDQDVQQVLGQGIALRELGKALVQQSHDRLLAGHVQDGRPLPAFQFRKVGQRGAVEAGADEGEEEVGHGRSPLNSASHCCMMVSGSHRRAVS